MSPDTLIPNRFLRGQALKYKNESGSFKVMENNVRSPVIIKPESENSRDAENVKNEAESSPSPGTAAVSHIQENDVKPSDLKNHSPNEQCKEEGKEEDSLSSKEDSKPENEKENVHDKFRNKDDNPVFTESVSFYSLFSGLFFC